MSLHFAKNLERFGEQTALLLADGTAISYLKLAQLADHYAQRFVQFDVWPQQVCALQCRNNLTTIVAYLCCLRHQRPLLLLDPNLPQSQLDLLVRQLEIAVLIDDLGTMRRVSASAFRARADLALLLSTSGSTGDPKSVMLSLDNLHSNALAISRYLPIQMSDVAITALPMHYSYGLSVVNSHLLCGATVLLSDYSVVNKEFWQQMRDFSVTSLAGVAFSYKMLKTLRFERLPLPALRYLTQAGGPLDDDLRLYVQQLSAQKQLPVYLMYGQTEATARIAWLRPEYLADHADCIGEAIPAGNLFLRDMQSRSVISEAETEGELCYQGPNVMLGYAQNSGDLRATDKLSELATGDLAIRLPNGLYKITGRLKRMLKLQGKRLQLDQLEQLLQREHWQTVCTGRDDFLVVAVIDANAESCAATQLSAYLQQSLQLHPSLFKVLLVRDIPYTSNGKVHYQALLRIASGETVTEGPGGEFALMSVTTGLLTDEAPYSLKAQDKMPRLLNELNALTQHHSAACAPYQRLLQSLPNASAPAITTEQLPYLSVRLFKQYALQSIPDNAVFKTLYSSGTTGQPSRIVLDKDAAALQSRVLVRIMQHWLGKDRLPMLIIDHPGVVKDRSNFSARGAGIQGLAFMGRNHCYALNEDLSVNTTALTEFCRIYGDGPVLIFGFTFMVWHWLSQLTADQIQLPQAVLLHSGGWKKLQAQAVGNTEFKKRLAQVAAIQRVHNFYGMVEQIGAVFVECEHGHLHCPVSTDVLVRNPQTWQLQEYGQPGLLQLLSTLPRSYPGHSLLTEDRGILLGEDDCRCGRAGKYFQVLGRLALAEARGCSDTVQAGNNTAAEQ